MVVLKHFLAYLLTFIVRFIPRRHDLIVYGGAADCFVDNAKYCFLYGSKHVADFEHVWLTRSTSVCDRLKSRGYKCVLSNSLFGVWLALRARFFLFDSNLADFMWSFLAKGSLTFNLWHGIPFKKIGFDNNVSEFSAFGRNLFEARLNKPSTSPSWVLSPSESLVSLFSRSFRVEEERVVVGGYYRNLPFSWSPQRLMAFINDWSDPKSEGVMELMKQENHSKFIVYLPTFRDTGEDFISKGFPDLEALNRWCLEHDFFFLFKTHRTTKLSVSLQNITRLVWLDSDIDIYPLLPFSDMLITDYSSVFYDYALLNKPVLFYPHDLDEYRKSCRGFNFDYEEMVGSSPCVFDFESLLEKLCQWRSFPNRELRFFDKPFDWAVVYDVLRQKQ